MPDTEHFKLVAKAISDNAQLLSGRAEEARSLYQQYQDGLAYPFAKQTMRRFIRSDFDTFLLYDLGSAAMDQIAGELGLSK
jgi:hypothetical protein